MHANFWSTAEKRPSGSHSGVGEHIYVELGATAANEGARKATLRAQLEARQPEAAET